QSPLDAQRLGIRTVYQEVNLCTNLSVAENIFLGSAGTSNFAIRWRDMRRRAAALLDELNVHIDVAAPLSPSPLAVQQMVAIARADRAARRHRPRRHPAADPRRADLEPDRGRGRDAVLGDEAA